MSTQREEQMAETNKPKIMTGFIHYNDSDDLVSLFETLNEFRKNYGLKYSHQGNVKLVFFNINSEHLGEFAKVRPFKISRFQTKTEYQCDEETANKLMGQKDSFVRMLWDETSSVLTFMSRTTSRVHGNLVRRIFKDSGVSFNKDTYRVLREESTDGDDVDAETQLAQVPSTQAPSTQAPSTYPVQARTQSDEPDDFQRVTNKRTKKSENVKSSNAKSSSSKVLKESETNTKPKARGTRTPKATA